MVKLIDDKWLEQVNDSIDEQIQLAMDNVVSELEYQARTYIDNEVDNCINNIRMETNLDFSGNKAIIERVTEAITKGVNDIGVSIEQ